MGKWNKHLLTIQNMAGKYPTNEIASAVGTTTPNLHKICHRNNISLPRDPNTYKGGGRKASEKKLEAAKNLLLNAGYKVYMPDPFSRANT